jgi:hypothetical protein
VFENIYWWKSHNLQTTELQQTNFSFSITAMFIQARKRMCCVDSFGTQDYMDYIYRKEIMSRCFPGYSDETMNTVWYQSFLLCTLLSSFGQLMKYTKGQGFSNCVATHRLQPCSETARGKYILDFTKYSKQHQQV